MKNLLFLFLIPTAFVHSQNWDLFPLGIDNLYGQEVEGRTNLRSYHADTVVNSGIVEDVFINGKSGIGFWCRIHITFDENAADYLLGDIRTTLDIVQSFSDTSILFSSFGDYYQEIMLLPRSQIGESWMTRDITMTCTSIEEQMVLGVLDSVKTITCSGNGFDGVEIVLSKSFGLLRSIPLELFFSEYQLEEIPEYFSLIGYSNENEKVGLQRPKFDGFFQLSAGDILFWEGVLRQNGQFVDTTIYFHRDSITSVSTAEDIVIYGIYRESFDEEGFLTDSRTFERSHRITDEGAIIEGAVDYVDVKDYKLFGYYEDSIINWVDDIYVEFSDEDTVFFYENSTTNIVVTSSQSECPSAIFSAGGDEISYKLSSKVGLECIYRRSAGSYEEECVIGSIIDGISSGQTDIVTSTENIHSSSLHVYPIPCNDHLFIEDERNNWKLAQVYNATGSVMQDVQLSSNRLDVRSLPAGVYFLILHNSSGQTARQKFTKSF